MERIFSSTILVHGFLLIALSPLCFAQSENEIIVRSTAELWQKSNADIPTASPAATGPVRSIVGPSWVNGPTGVYVWREGDSLLSVYSGTANARGTLVASWDMGGPLGSKISFGDIDNDGDKDIVMGMPQLSQVRYIDAFELFNTPLGPAPTMIFAQGIFPSSQFGKNILVVRNEAGGYTGLMVLEIQSNQRSLKSFIKYPGQTPQLIFERNSPQAEFGELLAQYGPNVANACNRSNGTPIVTSYKHPNPAYENLMIFSFESAHTYHHKEKAGDIKALISNEDFRGTGCPDIAFFQVNGTQARVVAADGGNLSQETVLDGYRPFSLGSEVQMKLGGFGIEHHPSRAHWTEDNFGIVSKNRKFVWICAAVANVPSASADPTVAKVYPVRQGDRYPLPAGFDESSMASYGHGGDCTSLDMYLGEDGFAKPVVAGANTISMKSAGGVDTFGSANTNANIPGFNFEVHFEDPDGTLGNGTGHIKMYGAGIDALSSTGQITLFAYQAPGTLPIPAGMAIIPNSGQLTLHGDGLITGVPGSITYNPSLLRHEVIIELPLTQTPQAAPSTGSVPILAQLQFVGMLLQNAGSIFNPLYAIRLTEGEFMVTQIVFTS